MKSPGILRFKFKRQNNTRSNLSQKNGSDELFIIFRDLTSRMETYGAGRFLYAKKAGKRQS